MSNSGEQIKRELNKLIIDGIEILADEFRSNEQTTARKTKAKTAKTEELKAEAKNKLSTMQRYQAWYSQALPTIRQILPERYSEFLELYKLEKRKDDHITFLTYTISDYWIGLRITNSYTKEQVVDAFGAFVAKFQQQITILESAESRLDSALADIRGLIQAELFDDELEAASELLKKGHLRAAGVLTGVTIERHLANVAGNHNIKLRKQNPTISDFNDELKTCGVYDVPTWRLIQRLGDIRNLCAHAKGREPTKIEVEELVDGTQRLTKTVF